MDALLELAVMFGIVYGAIFIPGLLVVVIGKLLHIKGFDAFKW